MRRLMVLAIGATVVGWAVNSLLRTDKDKLVSAVMGPPREKRAVADAPRRNVVSEASVPSNEDVNSNEAVLPHEEEDTSLAGEPLPEQSGPFEEPTNSDEAVFLYEEEDASLAGEPPPKQSASFEEPANTDEAVFLYEEEDAFLADEPLPEQSDPFEQPANVILLEAFQAERHWESETGDSPPPPATQNGQARMKRARDAVDERFQGLRKKRNRRKTDAA